jgi:hypothetical protein
MHLPFACPTVDATDAAVSRSEPRITTLFDLHELDAQQPLPIQTSQIEEGVDEEIEWTLIEIEQLHAVMFDVCLAQLSDPETPLDEVIDWLRWVISDPRKDSEAFSFNAVMRLHRRPDVRNLQETVREGSRNFLGSRLAAYPPAVADMFWHDPDYFASLLDRNPQWLNEALRKQHSVEPFGIALRQGD